MWLSCPVPIALCASLTKGPGYHILSFPLLLLMWPPVLWVSRGSQRSYSKCISVWVSNEWGYFGDHLQGSKSSKISQIRFLQNRFFRKAGLGWARLQVSCFHNVDDALSIFVNLGLSIIDWSFGFYLYYFMISHYIHSKGNKIE